MIICIHRNVGIWYSVLEKKFHIRSQNPCGHPLFTTTQSLDTEPVLTVFSLPQEYDLISCGGRGGRGSVTHIPRRWERLFPDDDVPHNPHPHITLSETAHWLCVTVRWPCVTPCWLCVDCTCALTACVTSLTVRVTLCCPYPKTGSKPCVWSAHAAVSH